MEILSSYNGKRCHATVIDAEIVRQGLIGKVYFSISNPNRYIGEIDGYSIYPLSILFNQFGFFRRERWR